MATAEKIESFSLTPALSPRIVLDQSLDREPSASPASSSNSKRVILTSVPPRQAKKEASFDSIMEMIAGLQNLQIALGNLQGNQLKTMSTIADKLHDTVQARGDDLIQKMQAAEEQRKEAEKANFWVKLGSYILAALATVLTFGFAGPCAAALVLTLSVLQETGMLDKMFQNIDSKTLSFLAKLGFCVAVGFAAAGIAAAGDCAISGAAANASVQAARNAAVEAGDLEMANLGGQAAEVAQAEMREAIPNTLSSLWKTTGINLGVQTLITTNSISDLTFAVLNPGNDPDKQKKAAWTAAGLSLCLSLGSLGLASATKGGMSAAAMSENLSHAASTSKAWALLNGIYQLSKNTNLFSSLLIAANIFSDGWQIKRSTNTTKEGHLVVEQGVIKSDYTMMKQDADTNAAIAQRVSKNIKGQLDSLAASDQRWLEITQALHFAAEILA